MPNKQVKLRRGLIASATLVAVNLLIAAIILVYTEGHSLGVSVSHLLVLGTFVFAIVVWNRFFGQRLADPINYLLVLLVVFHSSESILSLVGRQGLGLFISAPVQPDDFTKANVVVLAGLLFFLIGAILGQRPTRSPPGLVERAIDKEVPLVGPGQGLLAVGLVALLIDFDPGWLSARYTEFGEQTGIRLVWKHALPVAGFLLVCAKKRQHRRQGTGILIGLAALYLLMGNRGYAVALLIAFFWLYNFRFREVRLVWGLVFGFGLVVLVAVFYQLKPATLQEKLSFEAYLVEEFSPVTAVLSEASKSYRTVIYTLQAVPERKRYDYGASYAWAATTIVPNLLGDKHPAQRRENPSEWFKWEFNPEAARLGYGYGFSVIAEGYYNFGLVGAIGVMLLGGLLISRLHLAASRARHVLPTVLLAIFLQNFVWGVRNAAESIVRPLTWEILFLLIAYLAHRLMVEARGRPPLESENG